MRDTFIPGTVLVLFCCTTATPVAAAKVPPPAPCAEPSPSAAAAHLYSRRARRIAQSYLRLKLLEMREADLERAREAIVRRLGPEPLLVRPAPVPPAAAREAAGCASGPVRSGTPRARGRAA